MWNDFLPLGFVVDRVSACLHQAEVLRLPVCLDEIFIVELLHKVLMLGLECMQWLEFTIRRIGVQYGNTFHQRRVMMDVDHRIITGLGDKGVKATVFFFVDNLVFALRSAQFVPHHLIAEQGLRVLVDVEHRLVIIRPDHSALGVLQFVRQQLAGVQILETNTVNSAPNRVLWVSE